MLQALAVRRGGSQLPGPLQLGKLSCRGSLNAVTPGQLVFIADQFENRRYLVDTGAAFSILPHSSPAVPRGPALSGPGGASIACWGEKHCTVSFGGEQYEWNFLLAAVSFPILGIDFLKHYGLLVDPAGQRLVKAPVDCSVAVVAQLSAGGQPSYIGGVMPFQAGCNQRVPTGGPRSGSALSPTRVRPRVPTGGPRSGSALSPSASESSPPSPPPITPSSSSPPSSIEQLLESFPEVVNASKLLPTAVVHDVVHHIKTTGPPIACKFRRLEGDKLEAARAEFAAMEADGIVRRSTSPWASPLHMVPKKDGTWRPCGDFRRLNLVTEPDVYPLPNMLDFADRLHDCTVFSKIDLRKGYWQVPVRPEDVPKTAVATPFGLFEFVRMPFGLRNAGSSFQRMMDRVVSGLPFAYVYLDDLRVASTDHSTHLLHLQLIFQRLSSFGLVISLEKCQFLVDLFEFLGHHGPAAAQSLSPATWRRCGAEAAPCDSEGATNIFRPDKFLQAVLAWCGTGAPSPHRRA